LTRGVVWAVAAALVVLCTRSVVYALNPGPLALHFAHQGGGPALPLVALVSLALGLGAAAGVLRVAALGVRERRLLEPRRLVAEPRLRIGALLLRWLVLFAVTSTAFALVESTIHWRAGLGWHGISCLTGPVHRDAIPVLGALSALAVALAGALEHVLAWMRRTFALLRGEAPRLLPSPFAARAVENTAPSSRLAAPGLGARAPPVLVG